ncbi:uncharacterized protein LOC129988830 isoform X1 [Argiope bruennichi]|uniref:uncharacterized protein LOC129988830 isoform X1 n=1 Tax=Argiope bruennichi TaxID=94029 RepID=UPI0024946044|nr:uncharacterized protein LOC129988830 isoform X1 [Argiope bruennichi]
MKQSRRSDALLQNPMNFERLEDFSSYTSCIKFFGKPIIPPLVTAERRDEIYTLRASAVKKEIEILKRRESYSHPSRKVKEIYHMVAEHLGSSSIPSDFVPYFGNAQRNVSALHSFNGNGLISSPSADIRSFESSMHMSMTKIPSSDICSTVHTGVIVCPDVYNKKHENTRSIDVKSFSRPVPPNEFCFHMANPECSLCQTEHPRGPFPLAGVPYINSPAERICSVSDEEQTSVAEETEFESLVTVISGKKINTQDTDNESTFTCLTQSTDLEKYMDYSIEYSSTDDGASLSKSQISNQLNISSRSDDASSETLVNTESELTPCASALPELNGYTNEYNSVNFDTKREVSSLTTSASPDLQQRAHSVDSYMKIIKTCARKLYMKKSQSEPSHSDMSNLSNNFLPLTSSCEEDNSKPANLKMEVCDALNTSKNSVHLQITDTELSCDNIGDSPTEEKKTFKKGHIRTNSYTLEEPSSALIMAHADCNCKDDSETVMSPHSCSSEKVILQTQNPAFKKEKINIVLPPTPDRDKYFPILSSASCYQYEAKLETLTLDTTESEALPEDSSLSNITNLEDSDKKEEEASKSNVTESESTMDDISSQSNTAAVDDEEVNLEQVEILLEEEKKDTISEIGMKAAEPEPNEQNIVISSTSQSKLKGDDLQAYLNEIILEIQEKQQSRVQKLLEEQNKQWLQLQEEFKEQEKLLCVRLNLVGIPSTSDNVLENKPPSSSGDKSNQNLVESMPSDFQLCPDLKSLYNSNIINIDDKENLTTTENYSNTSKINLPTDSENKISDEGKAFVNENLFNTFTQHSNISGDSVAPSDKNITNTLKSSVSADNSNFSFSFTNDSLERSHTVHSTISSRSASSLEHHKPQSFNDSAGRCSSAQSGNFATSIPCSHSHSKMNNISSRGVHPVSYGPTISTSSYSLSNSASENIQEPTYKKPASLKLKSGYDTDGFLKDRVCDTTSKWLGGAYPSIAISSSSHLAAYSCSHSEMQLLTDQNNQTNVFKTPNSQRKQQTEKIIPPTYHPSLHCDNMALNEMGKYSQNLSACQHVSSGENFGELSVFTSLGNCTSMALPIICNSIEDRYFEKHFTCSQDDAFKEPATNLENSHFDGAIHFNSNKQYERETNASAWQQWHHGQNDFSVSATLKNKSSDLDQMNHMNSTILDSNAHSHTSMSRKVFSKHPLSIPVKSQSDSSISQNLHKMPPTNAVPTTQAKVEKQIISSSLTNLKRKHSKDFIRDPILLRKFEKLPAFVKGYLTRRLFKTERVQGLIKTLQDTALLIGKLGEELTLKGDAVSEHDVDFHRQLIVQLMTTFHSIYDIFCTISIKERMKIISESRSLEQKKKAAEKSKDSPVPVVTEKTAAAAHPRRSKLSAATIKALERKKRSSIDNRTYTVEDLKGCRVRIHSSTSSKSHSSSPSRIYKSSVGLALKRKTTNVRKTQHWK